MTESFWSTLKTELYDRRTGKTRSEVVRWIEIFYNRRRRHSPIGYRSPVDFENDYRQAEGAAVEKTA